jgi:group I intron endonuclease
MAYCVYCHTFPNGKKYIGITKQEPSRRWRNGKGYEGQPVFNAILKYGWDNICHEILFKNLTKAEAEAKEIELIEALETNSHKHGYNVENGGNSSEVAEETKKKLSKSKKEYFKTHKHWNEGHHLSDETKFKISKSHKGKKMSDDQKEKLRERFSGNKNPMYGIKMSKEHQKKLQRACVIAKSMRCKCVETGVIYSSMAEASRETGINERSINYVCHKNPKYKTAGGYHWEFEEVI